MSPPIQPNVNGPSDTSNYDSYSDTEEEATPLSVSQDPFGSFATIVTDPTMS